MDKAIRLGGRLVMAAVSLAVGAAFGVGMLELVLRATPELLFRGMALPRPVDAPLNRMEYTVRYSDADAFAWRPDLIRPLGKGEDRVEAQVVFETDELGFRNTPGLPEKADAVALGTSITLAGHLVQGWTGMLAQENGLRVVNLAQPGSDLKQKREYYRQFGAKLKPDWVVVEIAPSLEIMEGKERSGWLTAEMLTPLAQRILKRWGFGGGGEAGSAAIYPLEVDIGEKQVEVTCCLHYMEFYSITEDQLARSKQWEDYSAQLEDFSREVTAQGGRLMILLAPTKPDVYFLLANEVGQMAAATAGVRTYELARDGRLWLGTAAGLTPEMVQQNALAGRNVVLAWAWEHGIAVADATEAMMEATQAGEQVFMVYDSHWNARGHALVSQVVWQAMQAEGRR